MNGRSASHRHTRADIVRACELGVPLRVSVITPDGAGAEEPRHELEALGVTHIGADHVRPYGRGSDGQEPDCYRRERVLHHSRGHPRRRT